jgi:DUF2946 family protein
MKTWRICLLLLLAVLLPVRGAVAASMLCPIAKSTQENHAVHDHAAMEHPLAGMGGSDDGHSGHDHTASDNCNMCLAYCSLTPLASKSPTPLEPLAPATVKFSELSAPAPSFLSEGQERPPRTI